MTTPSSSSSTKISSSTTTTSAPLPSPSGILWSCIARDDIILVEAGEDAYQGAVSETAKQLLQRKATPGWEFQRCRMRHPHGRHVRGVKFHLYEYVSSDDEDNNVGSSGAKDEQQQPQTATAWTAEKTPALRIWVFACVYNVQQLPLLQAQAFLEKLVILTELFRDEEYDWQHGSTLAAQRSFGPILYQRMQEVGLQQQNHTTVAQCNEQLDGIKLIMGRNIDLLLQRGERLDQLQENATQLQKSAIVFKKKTRELRRAKMWQDAQHGIIIGTAVAAGVSVVAVPTLIAIL